MKPKRQGSTLSQEKNLMLTTETWCQMWQPAKAPEELNTHLVVPDLHQPVICPRNEVWLVPTTVIVNAVYSFLMAFQGEVGRWWSELPHLARKDPTKHNRVYSVPFVSRSPLANMAGIHRYFTSPKRNNTEFQRHSCFLRWKTSTTAQQTTSPSLNKYK